MKVSELTGAELDLWVARAESLPEAKIDATVGRVFFKREREDFETRNWHADYMPSQRWEEAGPIIDRENIELSPRAGKVDEMWTAALPFAHAGLLAATLGPTPLIAAMRAFVASKFGEDVPEAPHA